MATTKQYLALDMGAESGRGVVGGYDGARFTLDVVHRFPNGPVRLVNQLHWDLPRQFSELQNAIGAAVDKVGPIASLGVDTWGVDFGLLGADGTVMGNPCHYRDTRTDGMMERAFEKMPREEIYDHTGIQFMQLNTLFQLYSMVLSGSPLLKGADQMLFMPDLFHYLLTGERVCEFSIATTSQMFDVRKRDWARPVFERLGLPLDLMGEVSPTGTVVGPLLGHVAEATGAGAARVVAPACHDTGSAVAAVPARGDNWAYLSSGTWSLMGAELAEPIVTPEALEHSFTNEGGVGGTTRFLKNIMGLWLVQECRRQWAADGAEYTYDQLTDLAAKAKPFVSLVDPDDPSFASFGDMPARIAAFCRKTGQPAPTDHGAFVRCALESLALCYRVVLEGLEAVLGRKVETLHIVGGGSQNRLLNQFTADALGIPVVAGPVEATALGNVMVQAIADGELADVAQGREAVRASFDVEEFAPRDKAQWDEAFVRYERLRQRNG